VRLPKSTESGKDMQTETPFLTMEDISRIQTFCKVSEIKDATLSLAELLQLMALDMSEEELAYAWRKCDTLNRRYSITSAGLINKRTKTDREIETEYMERIERAKSNMYYAVKFRDFLRDKNLTTLAISGSTSYLSVSKNDDLDLFYIAKKDTMWISFTKALLLARLFRLKEKNAPWICLSFVADEGFLEGHLAANHNALIARDAMSAMVIKGESYYNELLEKNSWIAEFFPKFYKQRLGRSNYSRHHRSSTAEKMVNTLLFCTVGTCIRIKSVLLNRKLAKMGRNLAAFTLRIGRDHCVYESASYHVLKRIYSDS
jgi:hypothetical protein